MIYILAASMEDAVARARLHSIRGADWDLVDTPEAASKITLGDMIIYTARWRENPMHRQIEKALVRLLGG